MIRPCSSERVFSFLGSDLGQTIYECTWGVYISSKEEEIVVKSCY